MLHRAGDREEARNRLVALWEEAGPHGDPLHRCTVAHYVAGTQDDPWDALRWDQRALAVARGGQPDGLGRIPSGRCAETGTDVQLRAFIPSLHLSLAAAYTTLHHPVEARRELRQARQAATVLTDGPYGQGVREAIALLERRLDAG
ncbi:hypothetical protein ACFV3R_29105 [Streptomyces sp. NPDC059740]|uniref:hypothetical protein n=1 Tax=Streptomyces sp. NPDC059740 TaxID=3346926 RepID=UPI0036599521